MTLRNAPPSQTGRLGAKGESTEALGVDDSFGAGKLWIGTHAADGDLLVFDPAEADPAAARLSFYSMSQLRHRVFPRDVVARAIRELTDEGRLAQARIDYENRDELRAARDQELTATRAALIDTQRQEVLGRHERYLAALGVPYQGVQSTPSDHHRGRRVTCRECGIALDDFARSVCGVCHAVLCSCGSCACGSASRSR